MADSKTAGPMCRSTLSFPIDGGTLSRRASPTPGALDMIWLAQPSDPRRRHSTNNTARAHRLYNAYLHARGYVWQAIKDETGYFLEELGKDLLNGLLISLCVIGGTSLLGAAIGGIIGGVFGAGAGAIPGGIAGFEAGVSIGVMILSWFGLGFLIAYIANNFGELTYAVHEGVRIAWDSAEFYADDRVAAEKAAGHQLARACGIAFRLVFQAMAAWLLKRAGVSSAKSSIKRMSGFNTRVEQLSAEGGMDAAVEELCARLSSSRLGSGFANWIRNNYRAVIERFGPKEESGAATAGSPNKSVTPSKLQGARPTEVGGGTARKAISEGSSEAAAQRYRQLATERGVMALKGEREASGILAAEREGSIDAGSAIRGPDGGIDYQASINGKPFDVDVKSPVGSATRPYDLQARDIGTKIDLYDSATKVVVDLKEVEPNARAQFVSAIRTYTSDHEKVIFVNK